MDDYEEFEDEEATPAEIISAAHLIITSGFSKEERLAIAILSMTGGYYTPKDVKELMDYLNKPGRPATTPMKRVK